MNNTAYKSRSDTLLKTVEAGSSYSMNVGTQQMDRVTDPTNRQYTAFTVENAMYYMRQHLKAFSLPMQRQLEAAALLELVLQVFGIGCRRGAGSPSVCRPLPEDAT